MLDVPRGPTLGTRHLLFTYRKLSWTLLILYSFGVGDPNIKVRIFEDGGG